MTNSACRDAQEPITAEAMVRLGNYVVVRRRHLGMYTREALAQAAGVSIRLLGDVERGTRTVRGRILGRIEQALGWAPGSADAVLRGGEPQTRLDRPVPADVLDAISEMYRIAAQVARLATRFPDDQEPTDQDRSGHERAARVARRCAACRGGMRDARRRRALRSRHWSQARGFRACDGATIPPRPAVTGQKQ